MIISRGWLATCSVFTEKLATIGRAHTKGRGGAHRTKTSVSVHCNMFQHALHSSQLPKRRHSKLMTFLKSSKTIFTSLHFIQYSPKTVHAQKQCKHTCVFCMRMFETTHWRILRTGS